jgi:hypothetical protein
MQGAHVVWSGNAVVNILAQYASHVFSVIGIEVLVYHTPGAYIYDHRASEIKLFKEWGWSTWSCSSRNELALVQLLERDGKYSFHLLDSTDEPTALLNIDLTAKYDVNVTKEIWEPIWSYEADDDVFQFIFTLTDNNHPVVLNYELTSLGLSHYEDGDYNNSEPYLLYLGKDSNIEFRDE